MKKIANLDDALLYQLRQLYDGEKALADAIPKCSKKVKSIILKDELSAYLDSTQDKMLKLDRAFSYLMNEPTGGRNSVIRKMIADTHDMLSITASDETRDAVLLACIQSINNYKIAGYRTSAAFAIDLQLEAVPDLLLEILQWERETDRVLTRIGLENINLKALDGSVSQ